MVVDPWHYPRDTLARQILGLFESDLSHALVFFAPRRMGKTEFLRQDILPLATEKGWLVFYFSFLDTAQTASTDFNASLIQFAEKVGALGTTHPLLKTLRRVSAGAIGLQAAVEWEKSDQNQENIKEILARLAEKTHILLLLDEVQALTQDPKNKRFVAALRTTLDLHKNQIKVIFTGSSQAGLRRMFSHADAPFFHFGQNLPFPELGRGFTDHLAHVFHQITQRNLDPEALWLAFQRMQFVPQQARALVERMALNPHLDLMEAKKQLLQDLFEGSAFPETWQHCSALEQLLLRAIASDQVGLFSTTSRKRLAERLGIDALPVSTVQSAIRSLQRKHLIGSFPERKGYFIEDPHFKNWIIEEKMGI